MLYLVPWRTAQRRRLSSPRQDLGIATPISPQPPGLPLVVSGTYAGNPSSITISWRQGGAAVGAPTAASSIAGGIWSGMVTTPAVPGTYTLRAAFGGTTLIAESGSITISADAPETLASFTFEGTGQPANTIARFGHGFPEGVLQPTDDVLLRDVSGGAERRTQMDVLAEWPDGSVKNAMLAAELPALADGATLAANFRKGEAHSSPGSNLSFATALAGRSAAIRVFQPSNAASPTWTFDPLAAIDTDRWHEGPLALSSRVEVRAGPGGSDIPPAALGGSESVRLVVDVIVTKDGVLELDVCWANDRILHEDGAPAEFGYEIVIDGAVVYSQKPAPSHTSSELFQYCCWIKRKGRRSDGTVYNYTTVFPPLARPDFGVLVASGLEHAMDLSSAVTPVDGDGVALWWDDTTPLQSFMTSQWIAAKDEGTPYGSIHHDTDPYYNAGLMRAAGFPGGRPEIGYRTMANAMWLTTGRRKPQLLAHRQFEAAAARQMSFYDWEENTPVNPEDWPKFLCESGAAASAPGTAKTAATGLPTDQRYYPVVNGGLKVSVTSGSLASSVTITGSTSGASAQIGAVRVTNAVRLDVNSSPANFQVGENWTASNGATGTILKVYLNRDITAVEHAHHGAFNFVPALLSGRRHCYDALAMKSLWATLDTVTRYNGTIYPTRSGSPDWRTLTPDHTTGRAWSIAPHTQQTRSFGWDLRDIIDAEAILPDTYPNRVLYTRNLEAWINAWGENLAANDTAFGELSTPIIHNEEGHLAGFMFSFVFYGAIKALRLGLGGVNAPDVIERWVRLRVNSFKSNDYNYRNAISGRNIRFANGIGQPVYTTWAQSQARTEALGEDTPADWSIYSGERDWHRNAGVSILMCTAPDLTALPLTLRADAADATVLFRSERWFGSPSDPMPSTTPDRYFGIYYNSNGVVVPGVNWQWNVAPVIVAGQSFDCPLDAAEGDVIGIIRTTGPVPRNSAAGKGTLDAFVIASQPEGNPFTVSHGGVIRRSGTGTVSTGAQTLSVYCRTWEGNATTEHRSVTATVAVNGVMTATAIAPAGPLQIAQNASVGAFVGQLVVSGAPPITVAIIDGDPTGRFAVDSDGTITVAASLSGESTGTRWLTFRASGPGGAFDRTVGVSVTVPAVPPDIQVGQTFDFEESLAGQDKTIVMTGDPAITLSITAGDPAGRFATVAPNILRAAQPLRTADGGRYTLTLRASNAAGSDTEAMTVNVVPLQYVWTLANTEILAAYDANRRVRPRYTGPLFRLIRLSDGAELDIGFDGSGNVSEAAITAFAQGGRTEVVAWYDQSPRGQHLISDNASFRPICTDAAGNLYRCGSQNRLALRFQDERWLINTAFATDATVPLGAFAVATRDWTTTGSGGRRLMELTGTRNADGSGAQELGLRGLPEPGLRVGRSAGNADWFGTWTNNAGRFIAGITSLVADHYRRVVSDTAVTAVSTGATHAAALDPSVLRVGAWKDSGTTNQGWAGNVGTLVVTKSLDLPTDIPTVRSELKTRYGV